MIRYTTFRTGISVCLLTIALTTVLATGPAISANRQKIMIDSGAEYKKGFFEQQTISDFKLGMTQEEAQEVVARDNWKGGWVSSGREPPETIEVGSAPFRQGTDTQITLFRYRTSDTNQIKIYAIEFIRKFDRDQSLEILTQKLLDKYGPPTNAEITPDEVILEYSPDKTMKNNRKCQLAYQEKLKECAGYIAWKKGPKFRIKVKLHAIEMTLEDQSDALLSQTSIIAKKNALKAQSARDASRDVNLDF